MSRTNSLPPAERRSLAAHKANWTRQRLLPCPFCGQPGKVRRHPPSLPEIQKPYYQAGCPDNHRTRLCVAVPLCFGNTRAEAIGAWNTRTPGGAS